MDGEPVDIQKRLLALNESLASSLRLIDAIADAADATGAAGLAFASHMLSESLAAWKVEMAAYVASYMMEHEE